MQVLNKLLRSFSFLPILLFCFQARFVISSDEDELQNQTRDRTTLLTPLPNCTLSYGNQNILYDRCLELNGGFKMFWNVPNKSPKGANVSIAFSSDTDDEYISIGKSTTGRMVGSSAMVGYPSSDGLKVEQYYLGGKRKTSVVPGGNLTVNNIGGENVGGVTTIMFSLLLNSTELNSTVFIWAKGGYDKANVGILKGHNQYYIGLVGFFAEPVSRNTTSCGLMYGGSTIDYKNCQTLNGNFTLFWNTEQSGANTKVSIAFNGSLQGYIGLGFGNGMLETSAIIGRVSDSGVVVKQYYMAKYTPSSVMPGGSLTVSNLEGETLTSASSMTIRFTISLATSDLSSVNLIWAQGSYDVSKGDTLNRHSKSFKGSVDFLEAKSTSSVSLTSDEKLQNVHGVLNAVGWGIIIPLGILFARYLRRKDPLWFYLHVSLQIIGIGLGVGGFVTGVQLKNKSNEIKNPHFAFAIVIIILAFLQITALVLRPKAGESVTRKIWNTFHHWSGRLTLIVAIVNIYIGFDLLDIEQNKYKIAFSVVLALVLAVALVLEVASLLGLYKRLPEKDEDLKQSHVDSEVAMT